MLLIRARRAGKAHPPEAQLVPEGPGALRGCLRGVQLGHPLAAAGDGKVRGHAQLASSGGHIRRGGFYDLLGQAAATGERS